MSYGKVGRGLILAIVLAALWIPEVKSEQPEQPIIQHPATPQKIKQGTNENPLAVNIVAPIQTQNDADHEGAKFYFEVGIGVIQTVIFLVQTLVFIFQWRAFNLQARILRITFREMRTGTSVARATTAAMKEVANAIAISSQAAKDSVAQQKSIMRPYLSLGYVGIVGQDSATRYRFEIRMSLNNMGNTAAHNVRYQACVDALAFPLREDFDFPINQTPMRYVGTIGPRQNFTLPIAIGRFLSDEEIAQIKIKSPIALYIWGTIWYEDSFNVTQHTNMCYSITWMSDGKTMAMTDRRNNDAS